MMSALVGPTGATPGTAHTTAPAIQEAKQTSRIVALHSKTLAIAEGGNYSIDIASHPVIEKCDAMKHYLASVGIKPEQGVYFGNQNQHESDRDAMMTTIQGLTVFAVDEKQQSVIPTAKRLGVGPQATTCKLREYVSISAQKRPAFIGFDVDDTLLGLREDKSKEELLRDRRELADVLARLAEEGTRLVFFSDNDSQVTLKRIGYPLAELVDELKIASTPLKITFYVSKMITKLTMKLEPGKKLSIEYDRSYGNNARLGARMVCELREIVGEVREEEDGSILAKGVLGTYYSEELTKKDNGRYVRNASFYPNFVAKESLKGNVIGPEIQFRDFDPETGDASMLTLMPFVPQHRHTIIQAIAEQLLLRKPHL